MVLGVLSIHVEDGLVNAQNEEFMKGTPFDIMKMIGAEKDIRIRGNGIGIPTNADVEYFSYDDGPYPVADDGGLVSSYGPRSGGWGEHYVSDVMYRPPFNPGGGYSADATGGAGDFTVGSTHEDYIGDQNGNGNLEWISYYSYRPWGEDGIDNDGDGCIDEKSYGDWDGQLGCDLIPDQMVYFAVGGIPDVGGKHGTLAVVTDWFSAPNPAVRLHRIFSMQPWESYEMALSAFYPQIVDNEDVISYYASEVDNAVNANPEMDKDFDDWYVGSIDARGFPLVDPSDHVCFAGHRLTMGVSSLRSDGYIITGFELHEEYDSHDWNGDSDERDIVAAYYVVDPLTGSCDQGVNGGVSGEQVRNSGKVLTPGFTVEGADGRDWNNDGDGKDIVRLWHDIDSSLNLSGHRYTSSTFTSLPGQFGFGFWGIYSDDASQSSSENHAFPLEFGGASWRFGGPQDYQTYYFLTSEEDGDSQTTLPEHHVGHGKPSAALARACIQIFVREHYLEYKGVRLIGGIADGNGDGDSEDTLTYIYCPHAEGGSGEFWVEPTSKYSKGLYEDPIPLIWTGFVYYGATGDVDGYAVNPSMYIEEMIDDDADGDLKVTNEGYHVQYYMGKSELQIIESGWVGEPLVQPGGNVVGRILLKNIGHSSLAPHEDSLLFTDDNHWIQELYFSDLGDENGIMDPDEIAVVYFALRVAAGSPSGIIDIHVMVVYGDIFAETHMPLPVTLKMEGNELTCYRHRQNALRAIRSFDMDDDWGMLHDLEPGGNVLLGEYGNEVEPEKAVLQLIVWYEMSCGHVHDGGVRLAHSVGMMLTTTYGMGIDFWGFVPGQEEGNEGNGNGGLTGSSRHEVYGF